MQKNYTHHVLLQHLEQLIIEPPNPSPSESFICSVHTALGLIDIIGHPL